MKKFFLILLMMGVMPLSGQLKGGHRHVLLLVSYHPSFPTVSQMIRGVNDTLKPGNAHLDIEYMDSKRSHTAADIARFKSRFLLKIARLQRYDLIITADDNALRFILDIRKRYLPGIPVVFFGVNNRELALRMNREPDVTGVVEAVSMAETLRLIRKIHGSGTAIHVIADRTPSGQGDLEWCRKVALRIQGLQLRVLDLGGMTWAGLNRRLSLLSRRTPLLLLSAYRDRERKGMDFHESLRLILNRVLKKPIRLFQHCPSVRNSMAFHAISKPAVGKPCVFQQPVNAARGPVYHLWYHGIGEGLLGGIVIDHRLQAKEAVAMGLRILAGTAPGRIPVLDRSPNVAVFDYRVAGKFGLDADLFPKGTVWLNREPSFLKRYGTTIMVLGLLVLILGLFVAVLFYNISKRKRVEQDLRTERNMYRVYLQSAPFGVVTLDPEGRILLVNPQAEKIMELSPDTESVATLRDLPFDRTVLERIEFKIRKRSRKNLEFRRTGKDGKENIYSLKIQYLDSGESLLFITDITRRFEAGTLILETIREKDLLIREIHHRVKNNMQIITSLMHMQAERLPEEVNASMQRTISRIKTISMVHEKLIGTRDRSRICLQDLIHDITYKQFWSIPGLSKRVQIVLVVPPFYTGIDTAIPIALIVNELADNAISHAFPGDQRGTLRVSMQIQGETAMIEVQDTGTGTPEVLNESSTGMKIVRILCAQLKGKITFPPSRGLLIRVEFPGNAIVREASMTKTVDETGISEALQGDIELFMGKED